MAVYSSARRGQHGRAAGRVRVGFKRKLPADQASIHRLDIAGWEVRVHEVADMGDERGALRRKLSGVTALLLTIPASPISSWGRPLPLYCPRAAGPPPRSALPRPRPGSEEH